MPRYQGEGWARNLVGLRAAAAAKAAATRRRVDDAIRHLLKEGRAVTFTAVAEAAPCSTAWLYAHADVKERIVHLREQHAPRPRAAIPPQERASDASKDAVIAALRTRVKALHAENAALRAQLEVAYGELADRRGAAAAPGGRP